jgi:hypothetical protein
MTTCMVLSSDIFHKYTIYLSYRDDVHNELSVDRNVKEDAELNVRDDSNMRLDDCHNLCNNDSNVIIVGCRVARRVAACKQCRG